MYKELLKLKVNKSTGLDGIPAKFFKDGATVIKNHLLSLLIYLLPATPFPLIWNLVELNLYSKKNSRSDVGNYRPVSILSIVFKIIECTFLVIIWFIACNLVLEGHTLLIHALFTSRSSRWLLLNTQVQVWCSWTYKRAFDTVVHDILCNKLQAIGVHSDSVKLFKSYLSERKQIVSVNQVESKPMNISCGVPQGSISGPLLFLCYVNDMSSSVNCNLLFYADDSALFTSGKDSKVISETLRKEPECCRQWLVDNKLSLHLGKTESILFGTKIRLSSAEKCEVTCDGNITNPTNSVKYLGIIEEDLSSESVAPSVIKKVCGRLCFLYRQGHFLNERSRRTLCTAILQCYFDYCCSSWFSSLSTKLKK